jgi:hypothetical protein
VASHGAYQPSVVYLAEGTKWMLTQKGVRRKLSKRIGFVSFLGQIAIKKGNKYKEIQGKAFGTKFA